MIRKSITLTLLALTSTGLASPDGPGCNQSSLLIPLEDTVDDIEPENDGTSCSSPSDSEIRAGQAEDIEAQVLDALGTVSCPGCPPLSPPGCEAELHITDAGLGGAWIETTTIIVGAHPGPGLLGLCPTYQVTSTYHGLFAYLECGLCIYPI